MKINYDESVFSNENKSGLVITLCSEKLSIAYTYEEIEALATVKALFCFRAGNNKGSVGRRFVGCLQSFDK